MQLESGGTYHEALYELNPKGVHGSKRLPSNDEGVLYLVVASRIDCHHVTKLFLLCG